MSESPARHASVRRKSARTGRRHADSESTSPPSETPAPLSPARVRGTLLACGFVLVYGALVSLLWRDTMWGAHLYGFFPWPVLAGALAVAAIALSPWSARLLARLDAPAGAGLRRWLPWAAAAAGALLFWTARERHLFWGDALPLSIHIPEGQRFHPDEPLTMYVHHLLYRLGGGHWSGATAVAIGSVVAGAAFAGWAAHWLVRRVAGRVAIALTLVAIVFQGYGQLFFGHVEDYTYLALALLVLFTTGVDFLEGRGGPAPPLVAGLVAFAFHVLGGLTAIPLAVLVGIGLADPARRRRTLVTGAIVAGVGVACAVLLAVRLGGASLFARFAGDVQHVLTNPDGMDPARFFSLTHLRDMWCEWQLLGPLVLPLLPALLVLLPGGRFLRTRTGVFLLAGTLALTLPSFVTGQGNLGPARNWDLFAASAIPAAFMALLLVQRTLDGPRARRVLAAITAVSLFHTVPWIALNASFDRTVERVLALPLGEGRNQMMLGTHYLNAGDLPRAQQWFERAIAADPNNANSQSGLGLALARQNRLADALGPMSAAVRLRPNVPQYRVDYAALLMTFGRWDDAAAQWRAALTLDRGSAIAWRGLSEALLREGRSADAVAATEEGLGALPGDPELEHADAEARNIWIARLGMAGRYDDARRVLGTLAARHPDDPRLVTLRDALAAQPARLAHGTRGRRGRFRDAAPGSAPPAQD